ncbi:hypothetical protein [Ruania zhangjianzhongii]|uniref:hypothetical protein n=1 Tax=Ruania zhangjianzhongii TaxID=2603206 RepID=UPI0011C90B4B|nr:hypothetical protein [Ruania zhangjianzhongii]
MDDLTRSESSGGRDRSVEDGPIGSAAEHLPADPHGLIAYADALRAGQTRTLYTLNRAGSLHRIWPGVYQDLAAGRGNRPGAEAKALSYRRRVLAAARRLRDPVFTSWSAAALLRLPIIGDWPEEVYVLSGSATGSRRGAIVRVATRSGAPEVRVDGVRVTSVEYTIIQLARHARLGAALVAADAALRDMPFLGEPPLTTRTKLFEMHDQLRPYHRSRRAEAVLHRATHLSGSPLETVSRLAMEELGFAAPLLQVCIPLEGWADAYLDFYWDDDIGGESDGDSKYTAGDDSAETSARLLAEKAREDELRRRLKKLARWGWRDAWTGRPLERKLLRVGVPRVRPAVPRFW